MPLPGLAAEGLGSEAGAGVPAGCAVPLGPMGNLPSAACLPFHLPSIILPACPAARYHHKYHHPACSYDMVKSKDWNAILARMLRWRYLVLDEGCAHAAGTLWSARWAGWRHGAWPLKKQRSRLAEGLLHP